MDYTQWISTVVAGGAVGLLFWNVRKFDQKMEDNVAKYKKETEETMEKQKKEIEDEDYLSEEKHELLCKNAMLTINNRFDVFETNVMGKLEQGEKRFGELFQKLETTIKNDRA